MPHSLDPYFLFVRPQDPYFLVSGSLRLPAPISSFVRAQLRLMLQSGAQPRLLQSFCCCTGVLVYVLNPVQCLDQPRLYAHTHVSTQEAAELGAVHAAGMLLWLHNWATVHAESGALLGPAFPDRHVCKESCRLPDLVCCCIGVCAYVLDLVACLEPAAKTTSCVCPHHIGVSPSRTPRALALVC